MTYLIAYTIQTNTGKKKDKFEVFTDGTEEENKEQATARYNEILNKENTYSVNLCKLEKTTEHYAITPETDTEEWDGGTIEFNGINYKTIEVENQDEEIFIAGSEELQSALLFENGDPISTEAENIDNNIAYYLPEEILLKGSEAAAEYIREWIDDEF